MLRNSLVWATGGGHIPALSAVAESPEYRAEQPISNYREAAQVVEFDPEVYFSGSGSDADVAGRAEPAGGGDSQALTPEQGADDLIGWLDEQLTLGSPL